MYEIQLKIIHHSKHQDNHNLNEKRQLADANNEMIQMLELSGKHFKTAIIKIFKLPITNSLETNEKIESQQRNKAIKKNKKNYKTENYNK